MSTLESNFATLLGKQPSDKERQRLYRVKDALGLSNNDALWLIIMALEHYENLYARIPKMIKEDAGMILEKHRLAATILSERAAEQAARSVDESIKDAAASVIYEAAKKTARTLTRRDRLKWYCCTVALTTLAFAGFGWLMHKAGHEAGYGLGAGQAYDTAKNEVAAASWANTPEGQLAYRFAQTGQLQMLARCTGKGWEIRNGICFAKEVAGEGVYGWHLP